MTNIYGKASMKDVVNGMGSLIETNSNLELSEIKMSRTVNESQSLLAKRLTSDANSAVSAMKKQAAAKRLFSGAVTAAVMLTVMGSVGGIGFAEEESMSGMKAYLNIGMQNVMTLSVSIAMGLASYSSMIASEQLGKAEGKKTDDSMALHVTSKLSEDGQNEVDAILKTNQSIAGSVASVIANNANAETIGNVSKR